MKNYYQILEISTNATEEQIKEQYHFLVHAWHPDKFLNPNQKLKAEERIKEINEAYGVLGNSTKRAQYDYETKQSSSRYTDNSKQERARAESERRRSEQEQQQRQRAEEERIQRQQAEEELRRKEEERRQRQQAEEEQKREEEERRQKQQTAEEQSGLQEYNEKRIRIISIAFALIILVVVVIIFFTSHLDIKEANDKIAQQYSLPSMEEDFNKVLATVNSKKIHTLLDFSSNTYDYDEAHQLGTLKFEVNLTQRNDIFIYSGWCAIDRDTLSQNYEHLAVSIAINNYTVPSEKIHSFENTLPADTEYYPQGLSCVIVGILTSDWPTGKHQVTLCNIFDEKIFDGYKYYDAGAYCQEYNIVVPDNVSNSNEIMTKPTK